MKNRKQFGIIISSVLMFIIVSLLAYQLHGFSERLSHSSGISVFLTEAADIDKLQSRIKEIDGVIDVNYLTNEQVMARFEETLGYSWQGVNPLPDMLEVLTSPAIASDVYLDIQSLSGIDYVAYQPYELSILAAIQTVAAFISIMMIILGGLAALLLIFKLAKQPLKENALCVISSSPSS